MPFPRELVNDDEAVILDTRPHWSTLSKPACALAVTLMVAAELARIDSSTAIVGIVLTLAVVAWSGVRYLRWNTTSLVVTTDRVVYRTGVLAKHGTKIPLGRINGVSFSQSAFDHLVGRGDLSIQAGGVGKQGIFRHVPGPSHVQDEIYRLLGATTAKPREGFDTSPTGAPATLPTPEVVHRASRGHRDRRVSPDILADGVAVSEDDADVLVELLDLIESYARSDLLPEGMAEHMRSRFVEAAQMAPGASVVRDLADALVALNQRLRQLRDDRREAS